MLELIFENRSFIQYIVSLVLGLAMWRWGGKPEKACATVFVVVFTIPAILSELIAGYALFYFADGYFFLLIDAVAAILFIVIAVNANRMYTLWIAGFQVVALAAHFVKYVVEMVSTLAHAVLVVGPSYFQLGLMLGGLLAHIRREKRFGEYRDWRMSAPQQPWTLSESGSGPRGGI